MNWNFAHWHNVVLALTLAFSFTLFFGCVQSSAPSSCSGVASEKLAECVHVQAVLEQNPFYCYSIEDKALRASCMRAATDPIAKKQLENAQRQTVPRQDSAQPAQTAAPAQQQEQPAPTPCNGMAGAQLDECIRANSVKEGNLLGCEAISDSAARKACLSQIAFSKKDVEICNSLAAGEDQDICRLYAKGETPSG